MTPPIEDLTSQRRVFTGAAWNLLGRGLPIIVALALTPVLVHGLGLERWGLFTLALALAGMVGVLDLGIGAALTRALADRLGRGAGAEAPRLIASAAVIVVAIGLPLAGLMWAAMPWLLGQALAVPEPLLDEAVRAFRVLCLAAPLIIASATLWGVIAAYQAFRAGNLVNIPLSIAYYLGPALALLAWDGLVPVMAALVACRLALVVGFGAIVRRLVPGLRRGARPHRAEMRLLLGTGAWSTVTHVTGSLVVQGDRFVVGALTNLAALAHYATPLDLVFRFAILTSAVCSSLGPALAAGMASAPARAALLLRRSVALLYLLLVPPAIVLAGFAPELLALWLGEAFAAESAHILRILVAGMVLTSLGTIPGLMLDAAGRFDLNAKLLLAQVPVTVPVSVAMIAWWGIEGAAVAQAMRQGVSLALRCEAARRLDGRVFEAGPALCAAAAIALAGIALSVLPASLTARLVLTATLLVVVPAAGLWLLIGRQGLAETIPKLGRRLLPGAILPARPPA